VPTPGVDESTEPRDDVPTPSAHRLRRCHRNWRVWPTIFVDIPMVVALMICRLLPLVPWRVTIRSPALAWRDQARTDYAVEEIPQLSGGSA
jgi:hypothetical protein